MRLLNPALDLERFFAHLPRAPERVLLLDYDGTLAPFHARPERATPYPRVAALLEEIAQDRSTRVVLISGRRLADLRRPLTRIRHSEAWGAHGWQRRTAGGEHLEYRPPTAASRHLQLAEARARQLEMRGARVERKVASVAVHWRGMPEPAAAAVRERLRDAWRGVGVAELEVLEFDGGVELRARGRNKGDAVNEALASCHPDAVCAYLGDDTTDEDAFAAIKGRGVAVLVRPALRQTCADLWLAPPDELVAFLERWRAGGEAA
jgi:trehalose 6-phosphate phosphatase